MARGRGHKLSRCELLNRRIDDLVVALRRLAAMLEEMQSVNSSSWGLCDYAATDIREAADNIEGGHVEAQSEAILVSEIVEYANGLSISIRSQAQRIKDRAIKLYTWED